MPGVANQTRMLLARTALAVAVISGSLLGSHAWGRDYRPSRTQDELANPHKGFMLWGSTYLSQGAPDDFHGASLYHVYVPWRELETVDQVFDWTGFEARHLTPILNDHPDASFVLRPVADYPDGVGSGISDHYTGGQLERDYPLFLEQPPLNIPGTDYVSCDGDGPGRAPDWNQPALAGQLTELVQALAQRYDGDARITAIQVGLLGLWGEWHQTGCPSLEPGLAVKAAVRDAYAASFASTRLQTRYARDPDAVGVEFGFHEDYFPSFTAWCVYGFPLCDDSGDWNLEWAFSNVTPASRNNWQSHPVSGESPLASQKNAWVNDLADVLTVLGSYHFSFLGPAGRHEDPGADATLATIKRALGFELHLDLVRLPDPLAQAALVGLALELANTGSAPVYHGFRLRLDLVDGAGLTRASHGSTMDLRLAQPGQVLSHSESVVFQGLGAGVYSLRAGVESLASGRPGLVLQSGPRDGVGRVVLGDIALLADSDLIFRDGFEP